MRESGALKKNADSKDLKDIEALTGLRLALEKISPGQFSRYAKLVQLLQCPQYGWDRNNPEDRVVIFTERIETMKFIAENLMQNLDLPKDAVQTMHGG